MGAGVDEWIARAIARPDAELVQCDGRVRRWVYVAEEQRYLRVVLFADKGDRTQRLLRPQVHSMNVKYFKDTGTALLEFSTRPVDETRELSENIYFDLDKAGNLVSSTNFGTAIACSFAVRL